MSDTTQPKRDWLTVHPVICFLLGCFLLSSCQAGCAMSTYYGKLSEKIDHERHEALYGNYRQ